MFIETLTVESVIGGYKLGIHCVNPVLYLNPQLFEGNAGRTHYTN